MRYIKEGPTLFFIPSRHPAAMNIFIPIPPGETQVSLLHHQLTEKLKPLQY